MPTATPALTWGGRPARVVQSSALRTQLDSVMRTVQRTGVCVITRYGRPIAVLVSLKTYEALVRRAARRRKRSK